MNSSLRHISRKINSIQFALLRYHDKKGRTTLHVNAKIDEDNFIICSNTSLRKLVNKQVNLIQKSENDYLYISGVVKEKGDTKTFFIYIVKACWFVRRAKGSLSWLQEKHMYDILPLDDLELAS